MLARRGAEAICRSYRHYSRVRIGEIEVDRRQFTVLVHPVPTPGLWNDSHPWTFMGTWDDNYLLIGENFWVSNHLSLHIRFNDEQVRGLVAMAAFFPPGEYTDHHRGVASSYMSLCTSEARQIAEEISAVVEQMHRTRQNASDTYDKAISLIPCAPARVPDGASEELTHGPGTAGLRFLTGHLIRVFFHDDAARRIASQDEADPGPGPC